MADKPLIALLTNNDDDVYCFRLELIQAIMAAGYRMLISCPDGPKFEVMEEIGLRKNQEFIYDDPPIDRRGTSVVNDGKLMMHYRSLFKKYRPAVVLTYTAKPNVYASLVALQLHIPVINNVTGLGSVVNESGIKQKFIMWLFKTAYRGSACIMFQNSTNMKLAKDLGWVKGDCKLIPGSGVALDRYPVQEYPNGGNGIEGEPVVFNYIGRILYDKGVDDLALVLMPFIESRYSVKTGRRNTAVSGVSQGATEALAAGFKWQSKIGFIGSFAPCTGVIPVPFASHSFWSWPILDDLTIESPDTVPYYIYLSVGSEDPWCIKSTQYYGEVMDEKGIPNQNDLVEGYDHGNEMWELGHYNFLQKIFLE